MSTISTNGWDTVFATTYYSIVNAQIASQWQSLVAKTPSLGQLTAALANNEATVNLSMAAWQLATGGDGNLVMLELPIITGNYKGIQNKIYDLAGQFIRIQLSLKWIPEPNQVEFSISSNLATIEADLNNQGTVTSNITQAFASFGSVTLSSSASITAITKTVCWKIADPSSNKTYYVYTVNTGNVVMLIQVYQYVVNSLVVCPNTPATPVTVISAGDVENPVDGPILGELISKTIDQNIQEFSAVFAAVDVVTSLASDDAWAWLQPTMIGYAVAEPSENATNDNSTFAILSMVNNNPNPNPYLQADPNAIASGCSSSLLISPDMFVQNILLPGASSVFKTSTIDDFGIDTTGLSVSNNNTVTWGDIALTSSDTVTLSVAPGDFTIGVVNDRVDMTFKNLNYPITGLGINVGQANIIWCDQFQLGLKTGTNGNQTLWYNPTKPQPAITDISMTMSSTYYTIQEITGCLLIAFSIIGIGGAVGKELAGRAAARANVGEAGAVAGAGGAEVQNAMGQIVNGDALNADASTAANSMLTNAAIPASKANIWAAVARFAAWGAGFTGAVDGGMTAISAMLEASALNNWDNTPAFTNFAEKSISQYFFGDLKGLTVNNVALATSFQIGFNTASKQ
ncbi:clostridium P-47 protein-domain-containing protein [Nemania sp. FL0916]|nr:clostridium P-47 protein-domain-containing protein [Nemania sp. FL0916]